MTNIPLNIQLTIKNLTIIKPETQVTCNCQITLFNLLYGQIPFSPSLLPGVWPFLNFWYQGKWGQTPMRVSFTRRGSRFLSYQTDLSILGTWFNGSKPFQREWTFCRLRLLGGGRSSLTIDKLVIDTDDIIWSLVSVKRIQDPYNIRET